MKFSLQWIRWLSSVSLGTLCSRLLGFLREIVFATVFGAQAGFDGFITASRIPNMLRRLFAEGALTQAFIPILSEMKVKESPASMAQFQGALLMIILLATGFICLLFMLFPGVIISFYAWGFDDIDPRYLTAISLLPILALFLPLISVISFFAAILNSYRRFFLAGLLPAISNVFLISSAWYWRGNEQALYYLSIALVMGALVQFSCVFIQTWRVAVPVRLNLNFQHPGISRVGKLLFAGLFGLSATQISLFIDGNLASFLPIGSMSWLYYAERLIYLPLGTIGVGIATIALPAMSEGMAKKDLKTVESEMQRASYMIMLLGIPASVGLFLAAEPIMSILFERGKFTHFDSQMSAFALQFFSLGLPFMMLMKVWIAAAYSMKNAKITVYSAFSSIGVNLMVALSTMPFLQHGAIALAVSCGAITQAVFLYKQITRLLKIQLIDAAIYKMIALPTCLLIFIAYRFQLSYSLAMAHPWQWLLKLLAVSMLGYFGSYFVMMRWAGRAK